MWQFPGYKIGEGVDWQLLLERFTWVKDMVGVPQDGVWHAEGDVFVHTRMVVEALLEQQAFKQLSEQDKHILVASAVLHDVEKRSTTREEEIDGQMRIVSPRHAKKGELTARRILYTTLNAPFVIRETIVKLVRWHGLPLWAIEKSDSAKSVIEVSLLVNTKHLALLATADVLGRICDDQADLLLRIEFFETLCIEQNCWGTPRVFATNYARYHYLSKPSSSPDYVPYEDLEFEVVMMCALPGTGKDYYVSRNLDLPVLSLDNIREEKGVKPTDKKGNGRVVQAAKERAKQYLRKKTSFVFNATNISKEMRQKWIGLFTTYGARVRIIYLEVSYKKMLQQNQAREAIVPTVVIDRMISKWEVPLGSEAHEIVFVVDGKVLS